MNSPVELPSHPPGEPAAGRRARTLAITSGKGGVGKTFMSANLAAALVRRGERVLVLDADLGLANLDVVLNLQPNVTLHDVFTRDVPLERALVYAPGGFTVLLAGSGLVEYSRLTEEVREKLPNVLNTLAPRFDRILLDTGAGISDVVLYAVSLAQDVLTVVTPEPTSMTDAYATIKVLAHQQQRRDIKLVVNQVSRPSEGRAVRTQLQQVIDRYVNAALKDNSGPVRLDLLGIVPSDPSVREAVQRRQLLMASMPGCAAAQAVGLVADQLVAQAAEQRPNSGRMSLD